MKNSVIDRNSRFGILNSSFVIRHSSFLLALILLLLSTSTWAGNRQAFPLPEDRGTAGTLAALQRLPVFVRVLHTTAHPDDESSATLTWLARKVHARTALLSLTRGDGGQNVLGNEKYEAMGLIRTGELLEADKIYGVETYFSTVFEFGFSKSAPETLSKWNHEATLEEVVRFIRSWRPTILISKWQGNSKDGHGHHQAAGLLTHEAFRAAGDSARFPEHLKQGLLPWQAKKLYHDNVRGDLDSSRGTTPGLGGNQADPNWTVRVNVGAHDPVLGRSYREIGSEGYSKHRSQGNASSFAPPGRTYDYYKLMDSTMPAKDKEGSFFDSIDTSLLAIMEFAGPEGGPLSFLRPELAAAQSAAQEAIDAFQPHQPERSAAGAARGAAILAELIRKVENSDLAPERKRILQDVLLEKQTDFEQAANAALGVYLTARTQEPTAVPGESMPVTVEFFNRGSETLDLKRVTLRTPEGWRSNLPGGAPLGELGPGELAVFKFTGEIAGDAKITEPFWYREGKDDVRYKTRATRNVFAPFDEPEMTAKATYRYKGIEISLTTPARAQVNDPIRGVDFREFQIVPALSVSLNTDFAVAPISSRDQSREFQVSVLSNLKTAAHGTVKLAPPQGWSVSPAETPFALTRKGESFTARYNLRIPAGTPAGTFRLEAVANLQGQEFRRGYRVISYPENWTRHLYAPALADLKIFDVKVAPNLSVGYVPGAGDEIPASLEQLGVQVRVLSADDLAFGDLSRYNAIVTGIRAYNVNEDLKTHNRRLLSYVEQGGILIVQYNTPVGRGSTQFPYGPYPMNNSAGDRITVEDSPVRILAPQHPVFAGLNKITTADFDGWVQERGLYFMNQWDPRYTPLLAGNDPGEESKMGGFLVTRHGKGYYIFSAYAWFRQLPAGVPGAFRIFANMLSLNR